MGDSYAEIRFISYSRRRMKSISADCDKERKKEIKENVDINFSGDIKILDFEDFFLALSRKDPINIILTSKDFASLDQ